MRLAEVEEGGRVCRGSVERSPDVSLQVPTVKDPDLSDPLKSLSRSEGGNSPAMAKTENSRASVAMLVPLGLPNNCLGSR